MSISERALLVQLSMGGFSGKRTAKDIAVETAESHGAEADSLEATLRLIPASELKGVDAASRACREYFDKNTLPWQRRGAALLPCKLYFDFQERLGRLLQARQDEVDVFMIRYEHNAVAWVHRLNGLAQGHVLPTADIVRERFSATVQYWPFPSGGDFRVDLDAVEVDRLRAAADEAAQQRVGEAVKDAVNRLRAVVRRYADNLRANENGRQRRITGSLEADMRQILEVLPAFNLTGDKGLEEITAECATLLTTPIETLREDADERARVQGEAERIFEKMKSILG